MSSKLQSEGSRDFQVFPESVEGDFTNWQSLTSSSAAFDTYHIYQYGARLL